MTKEKPNNIIDFKTERPKAIHRVSYAQEVAAGKRMEKEKRAKHQQEVADQYRKIAKGERKEAVKIPTNERADPSKQVASGNDEEKDFRDDMLDAVARGAGRIAQSAHERNVQLEEDQAMYAAINTAIEGLGKYLISVEPFKALLEISFREQRAYLEEVLGAINSSPPQPWILGYPIVMRIQLDCSSPGNDVRYEISADGPAIVKWHVGRAASQIYIAKNLEKLCQELEHVRSGALLEAKLIWLRKKLTEQNITLKVEDPMLSVRPSSEMVRVLDQVYEALSGKSVGRRPALPATVNILNKASRWSFGLRAKASVEGRELQVRLGASEDDIRAVIGELRK